MKILIDNGHGEETAGKRSPNGVLREYKYTREIAEAVINRLAEDGYDAERIVLEDHDISLAERCRRVNEQCKKYGKDNVILVSIHVNASGNGEWMNARGWCCYTSKGQTKSDLLAEELYTSARKHLPKDERIRTDKTDGDSDWEAGFYILKNTQCPAVLTENLFMDNKQDYEYLLSEQGRRAIVNIHVDGIVSYINKFEK